MATAKPALVAFRPALLLTVLLRLTSAFQVSPTPATQSIAVSGGDGGPTVDHTMQEMMLRKGREGCLPQFSMEEFANPINALSEQMHPDGKVFLVGDSVIGQICQLGSPGLCCSNNRPCDGQPSYSSSLSPWEIALDKTGQYKAKDWQHLFQFKARGRNNTAANTVYFAAPVVHDNVETVSNSVGHVTRFLQELGTTEKDVLVLGMIGNHYNHGLDVFDHFTSRLIRSVANPFPGRVVILGYSPQHFSGSGYFTGKTNQACSPSPLPGEVDPPQNSFRSSIFLYNVWGSLTNPRARLVDFYELLNPLWACHRAEGDCTHWQDPIISLQAQLILNALEKA